MTKRKPDTPGLCSPDLRGPAWTGWQYSLVRASIGAFLLAHMVSLLAWGAEVYSSAGVLPRGSDSPLFGLFPNILLISDHPFVVQAMAGCGSVLAIMCLVGWRDRIAAIGLWYILACFFGRNPLTANPSLPFIGWILLAHVFLPTAPAGSIAGRRRADAGAGWRFPAAIFAAAWIVMAAGYTYSGYTKLISPSWTDGSALRHVLENPLARPTVLRDWLLSLPDGLLRAATWSGLALELAFLPLAIFRRTRPFIWLAMLGMHLSLIVLIDFAELSMGMVLLHMFTFDPGWVRPKPASTPAIVFYDGGCALCNRFVRLLISEDQRGELRIAPLQGPTFIESMDHSGVDRSALPDSIVVHTTDGRITTRFAAVRHTLYRLGGLWTLTAHLMHLVPVAIGDRLYDAVAVRRKRLASSAACPMFPPQIRAKFLP